ncbi:MAG: hypothetical protein NZ750_00625 [Anaerolineae bacterium]|nr:hypothetical protein [Anaerolineae bacterium]MDW8173088.1 hypothetical protein [Anaerolineae bacterium]
MSNAGSPESPHRRPWWLLIVPLLLLGAGLLTWQGVALLLSIVAPPMPPLPDGAALLSHNSRGYGQDEWRYAAPLCASIAYYQSSGASCSWERFCPPDGVDVRFMPHTPLGRCRGEQRFADFAMRWRATLSTLGDSLAPQAEIRLEREIFWNGELPAQE